MRSIQSTNIVYGLQNIPVKVYPIVRDLKTGLSNACPDCKGDVGLKNVCKGCQKEIEYAELIKAYKITDAEKYTFTKEQISQLKSIDDSIEVLGTIKRKDLNLRTIQGSYYLLPAIPKKKSVKSKSKAWKILQVALDESENLIVVRFSIRSRQRIGVLVSIEDVIVLLSVAYNEQVNEFDQTVEVEPLSEEEKKMGLEFVSSLKEIDVTTIEDQFTQKLEELMKGEPLTVEVKESEDDLGFFKAN